MIRSLRKSTEASHVDKKEPLDLGVQLKTAATIFGAIILAVIILEGIGLAIANFITDTEGCYIPEVKKTSEQR